MQLQFLEPREVLMTNVNHAPEKWGEELKNAIDMDFELDIHKDELPQIIKNPDDFQRSFWNDQAQVIQEITELKFSSPKTEDQKITVRSHKYSKPVAFGYATITLKNGIPMNGGILRIKFGARVYPTVHQIGKMCDTRTSSPTCQITLEDHQVRAEDGRPDDESDED